MTYNVFCGGKYLRIFSYFRSRDNASLLRDQNIYLSNPEEQSQKSSDSTDRSSLPENSGHTPEKNVVQTPESYASSSHDGSNSTNTTFYTPQSSRKFTDCSDVSSDENEKSCKMRRERDGLSKHASHRHSNRYVDYCIL